MTVAPTAKPVTDSDGRVRLQADLLKKLRRNAGHSQESLARHCQDRRLCISIASIKRAEAGRPVLHRTARHFAECYGIELSGLLCPTEQQHHRPDVESALPRVIHVLHVSMQPGHSDIALLECLRREILRYGGHIEVIS
jgi:transcriptional regulator with XRE-family HTH domain